jgi:Protein of unknown function (DUF4231)
MGEEKFEAVERQAREIKERYVDRNRKWYAKHQYIPFLLFRTAGIITIIFSVTLPAVAALNDFEYRQVVIAFMSITIAALTGLSTFFHWERSWRGRNLSMSATDALVEKWELELLNARLVLTDPQERLKHVYLATSDLITNFRGISSSETEDFFASMAFPQSNRATQKDGE